MITEDYVSFETAKLLKEKGFDGEYDLFGRTDESELIIREAYKIAYEQGIDDECVIIPTLQMAMKWLREEHNICIQLTFHPNIKKEWGWYFMFFVMGTNSLKDCVRYFGLSKTYSSYEEACEAAIKCCLENLI